MTSENVDELVETTRSAMVSALEAISRPGPAHQHDIHVAPEDLQTPRAELPRQLGHPITTKSDDQPRRRKETLDESHPSSSVGSELSKVESRGGETTDDEMDEDAVLLRRPKEA
jgi:lysophosphatidate acyltransferase